MDLIGSWHCHRLRWSFTSDSKLVWGGCDVLLMRFCLLLPHLLEGETRKECQVRSQNLNYTPILSPTAWPFFFVISGSLGSNQRSGVSLYHSLSFYNPMWGEASWIYTYSSESFFYSSVSRQRWGDIQSDLHMGKKKSWYKLLVPFPLSGGIFVCDMYTNIAREKFHYLPPTDLITISFY